MLLNSNESFGGRLRQARKMAGWSLQKLADAAGNKLTKQAINKYEQGQMMPTSKALLLLSNALGVNIDFLLRPNSVVFQQVEFRKKAKLSKKDEEAIVERVRDFVDRSFEIEGLIEGKATFQNPIADFEIGSKDDVEEAAKKLRQEWNLGDAPILSVTEVLERQHVRIVICEESEDFDGLAVFSEEGIPVVAVNKKDRPVERVRFTIVHELAHLLLQFKKEVLEDKKLLETLCHYFSSCFLLPTAELIRKIGKSRSYIKIAELIAVKETFGISIRATVHRLRELKVITGDYYKRWVVYMSKTYGAKQEPGHYPVQEKAGLLRLLVDRALAEQAITLSKASALLGVDMDNLRKSDGHA